MATTTKPSSRPAGETARAPAEARQLRNQTLAHVRRELVLDAARSAFIELGMDKTSIREIAQRAGYTPGAIYSYFSSKEEVYGALLAESLERLNERVRRASAQSNEGVERLRAAAGAFFDFYESNPRDLDLGFYLFQGMKARGLTPELNDMLNAQLLQSLRPVQDELERLGMGATDGLQETTALFAHAVGILVLSHTGRIRMFKQASKELFDAYMGNLIDRAARATQNRASR